MGQSLSMGARQEITKKYAREYAGASKKERGRMLDELVATTGWSRANARRQVAAAMARKGPQRAVQRAPRPRTYGYDTLRLLICIWMLAGTPAGKYLAATMALWLPKLEQHGEFGQDTHRLTDHTRAQLLAVSGATIDRLLKPTRNGMRLAGVSGTKPGPLVGIDSDNGGEFINDALVAWAGERDLFFTRARPYHSNDCQSLVARSREDGVVLAGMVCPISTIGPHGALALICRSSGRARNKRCHRSGVT